MTWNIDIQRGQSYMDRWEQRFLSELVQLDTNSDEGRNYIECAAVLKRYCEESGLHVEVLDSQYENRPHPNIVATLNAGAKTTVLLCTHYDVVPAGDIDAWRHPPFDLTVEGDRVYGRGVSDDKGAIVASVSAARELLRRRSSRINLKILISPNEERGGGGGIDYLINGPPKIRGDFAIVVDSSPDYVSIGASGVLAGTITVQGKQGHAGYPFKFNNAIHLSVPLLNILLDYIDVRTKVVSTVPAPPGSPQKNLWGRFSITVFRAGSRTNIIPGKAEISFDCRLIPEESPDDVSKNLQDFFEAAKAESGVEADIVFTTKSKGWSTDPHHPFVTRFHNAVERAAGSSIPIAADLGGNDGNFFTEVGIPTVCLGTIAEDCNFHGVDEFLRMSDFKRVRDTIINFAEAGL